MHQSTRIRSMPLPLRAVLRRGRISVVVAAAALGGLTICGSSAAAAKQQTLKVLQVVTSFAGTGGLNANGNLAPAVGQGVVLDGSLYKLNRHKQGAGYGAVHTACTFTNSSGASVCTTVASLPAGKIVISGLTPADSTKPYTVPIVGGSRRYEDAKGHVRVRTIGGSNSSKAVDTIVITG